MELCDTTHFLSFFSFSLFLTSLQPMPMVVLRGVVLLGVLIRRVVPILGVVRLRKVVIGAPVGPPPPPAAPGGAKYLTSLSFSGCTGLVFPQSGCPPLPLTTLNLFTWLKVEQKNNYQTIVQIVKTLLILASTWILFLYNFWIFFDLFWLKLCLINSLS